MKLKDKKLKILFLSGWYPSAVNPMLGLFVERHARAVAQHCNVAVLYIQPCVSQITGKFKVEIKQEQNFLQVIIYYKNNLRSQPFLPLINVYRFYLAYKKGFRAIKKHFGDYDLIHVNILTRTGIVAYLEKLLNDTPYIITEHWSRYLPITNTYKGALRKWFTKKVVKNASAITTVTKDLKNAMLAHGLTNPNFLIVPNVVDTDFFTIGKKESSGLKSIIHISCFEDKSKNISGMLRALKRLSEKRNDFVCTMVGDGIDKNLLEKYASELGTLNKTVVFAGLKEGSELKEIYAGADFMLMFSNYETMSVVIAEGFSAGLPVVTTDVGGIPEVVSDDKGILIKKNNEVALENAINTMLDNYTNFDKQKLRQFAIDNYSIAVIGNSFFDIYQHLLEK